MPRIAASLMLLTAFAGAGCADPGTRPSPDGGATVGDGPPATAMTAALAAAGLDAAKLPPFDELDGAQLAAVMDTFTRALGIGCSDCHQNDYAVSTPRTRVARKMWDRFVRGLQRSDGGALYCDSCHAGQPTFLDRRDPRPDGALGRWMQASYVTPLERRDGAPHDCSTCHGSPFVGGFLDDWSAAESLDGGVAPDDADLGVPLADLGAPPDLGGGCESLLVCLDACGDGGATCSGACRRHASAGARSLLAAAQKCANQVCVAAGRCRSSADDSVDCDACFSNASAGGVTGIACAPAGDPSCGACAAEWQRCETM